MGAVPSKKTFFSRRSGYSTLSTIRSRFFTADFHVKPNKNPHRSTQQPNFILFFPFIRRILDDFLINNFSFEAEFKPHQERQSSRLKRSSILLDMPSFKVSDILQNTEKRLLWKLQLLSVKTLPFYIEQPATYGLSLDAFDHNNRLRWGIYIL